MHFNAEELKNLKGTFSSYMFRSRREKAGLQLRGRLQSWGQRQPHQRQGQADTVSVCCVLVRVCPEHLHVLFSKVEPATGSIPKRKYQQNTLSLFLERKN